MVQAGGNRPLTDIEVKVFTNGNSATNIRACQQFIKDEQLTRDQIVSITTNETTVEEGDNVLSMFYRSKSIVTGATPVDNIEYETFNNMWSWDRQMQEVHAKEGVVNIIAVGRSAKNIGSARCQSLWYTADKGNKDTTCNLITDETGNWDALSNSVQQFLNDFIPPHQLISVTMYEDAHPNTSGQIACVVTHNAGKAPIRLNESAARTVTASENIYSMTISRDETTELAAQHALQSVNRRGGQEGHTVSTCNDSSTDMIVCVVFSWDAIKENNIEEAFRPAGCGPCTIF